MNRRQVIRLIGGGTVVAGAAAAGFLTTRSPDRALAPWHSAGIGYADARLRALSHAILAPNPHNRQPWLVALEGSTSLALHADRDRLLPHTDPYSRQITIGLGCFLELLRMAGAEDGYRVTVRPFPEGASDVALDERPVAHVQFESDAAVERDPLFEHVQARRSLKEPFDTARLVTQQVLARAIGSSIPGVRVEGTQQRDRVANLRRLTGDAMALEIDTPHTYKESVDLFRIGKAEVEANPDGIDFSGPMFETLALLGQFSREAALDRQSTAFAQGREAVLENCRTAMGFLWLNTPGNGRQDQLAAGREWLRLNLRTTRLGLGIQPLSQALQEYYEMRPYYQLVHAALARKGSGGERETVQMLARIGYGPTVPRSPRWPIETRIANT